MSPDTSQVAAVIVTYNAGAEFAKRIMSLAMQVGRIVVVDNGSTDETLAVLEILENNLPSLSVIRNDSNIGLAAAQNMGIKAVQADAEWVLLMDDDSTPAPDMVKQMLTAYKAHPTPSSIAMLAPRLKDINTEHEQSYICKKGARGFTRKTFTDDGPDYFDDVLCVIASGSMVKVSALKSLGLMRAGFFIDYIDTDFALRLISHGKNIMAVKPAMLFHRLGAKTVHSMGGKTIIASNHSPLRRRTIYRNRAFTWRLHGRKVTGYILYDVMAAQFDLLRILFFEKKKFSKLKAAISGLFAGLFRKIPPLLD